MMTVNERTAELAAIHAAYLADEPRPDHSARNTGPGAAADVPADDLELLAWMRRWRNGATFSALYDQGNTSAHGGDQSAADAALVQHLLFATDGDVNRVDRLFRASALMRDKWDEQRGEMTYGQRTIVWVLGRMTHWRRPRGAEGWQHDDGYPLDAAAAVSSGDMVPWETFEQLAAHLREERRRREALEAENRALYQAIANPEVKTERTTAIALIDLVDRKVRQGKADADGFVRVYRVELSKAAGVSEDSAGTHVDRATKWENSPIEKVSTHETVPDPERPGETITRRVNLIRLRCPRLQALQAVGQARPPAEQPKHGGKRERCPEHPDAPLRRLVQCSVCDHVIRDTVDQAPEGNQQDDASPRRRWPSHRPGRFSPAVITKHRQDAVYPLRLIPQTDPTDGWHDCVRCGHRGRSEICGDCARALGDYGIHQQPAEFAAGGGD